MHLVITQISIAVQKFKTFNQTGKITSCRSGSAFVSTLVSIETRAPDKLKSKIWFKQYVDFSSLKKKNSLQVENSMKPCMLTIHQVVKDDTDVELSSIEDWLTVWNRYMAIYCLKYPHEQAKLAKHPEAVRDIAD